jgi:very-short-patch-repair endonuclease
LLEERVVALRESPTRSELALWELLSGRKLGVTFRRQMLVGRYIVDFVAHSVKLVVEVDGSFHTGARCRADGRRDAALRSAGYRVLRLEVELVLTQPAIALARVRAAL